MAETRAPARGLGTWAREGLSTFAALVLAAIMMVSVIDVVGRYLANRPLPGSSEITEILMAVLIYAGLPVVSQRNAHIAVDLLDALTPRRVAAIRNVVVGILCTAILAVIAWRLWAYADQMGTRDVTEYLKIPQAPIARVLSVLAGIAALAELHRTLFPVKPETTVTS
jgi:TRAP-type C4-dicarboxylate transport system permease small subunit